MKIITKAVRLFFIILTVAGFYPVFSQTNVSGGIFSNTTWTKANSPYIVTDTVVVFPGFTLTIQPGVVVKFNSAVLLELRQAELIAMGTNTDSITFTSNVSLAPGSWEQIILNGGTMTSKFNYCNFRYATNGLFVGGGVSAIIKNSNFNFNTTGLYGGGAGIIDTCNFINNGIGGYISFSSAVMNNCNFSNNQSGLTSTATIINNCTFNHNVGAGFSSGSGGGSGNKINNSTFNYNQTGFANARGCSLNNCTVNHNQSGFITGATISDDNVRVKNTTIDSNTVVGIEISNRGDSVFNCQIKYNGVGMIENNTDNAYPTIITKNRIENNSIGLQLINTPDNIYCNDICNNKSYDLKYLATSSFTIANNYWCTTDSASVQALVYDGHNNINYGLVNFMPINTGSCNFNTSIDEHSLSDSKINIFPNPASSLLNCSISCNSTSAGKLNIFDMLGRTISSENIQLISGVNTFSTDVSEFSSGIYFLQISETDGNAVQKKFVVK